MLGLEVRGVTTVEIAQPARGPQGVHIVLQWMSYKSGTSTSAYLYHQALHHEVLLRCLHRYQVHAHGAADVASIQPAGLGWREDSWLDIDGS